MEAKKKEIPSNVHEALAAFSKFKSDKFELAPPAKSLVKVIDIDPESDFYFEVKNYEVIVNTISFLIEYKPKDGFRTEKKETKVESNQVMNVFNTWMERVKKYDQFEPIYQDTVLKAYEEQFYSQLKFVDEDADIPFDLNQQLFLEKYLNDTKNKLIELKEGKTEDEIVELEILVFETDEIKSVLTKETKTKILKRLTKLWAKAQKTGLHVIKEILINMGSDFMTKLITG
ncbi:MAG: hypothetical protein K0R65_538 [Crocinitomicaceae bacterium]|jgi:REP element-mobilizing transposase RayT|nr:hypothetical protein [Crocinitomicaceae bacterium]